MKNKYITDLKAGLILLIFIIMAGCSDFLDEKSDLRLATPETVKDNQAMLDRLTDVLTGFALSGMASSDDYYLTDADYDGLYYDEDKRLYTWQPDHISRTISEGNDWWYCYKAIFIANSVLYNIDHYNIPEADNIKGQALVIRAIRYLDGVQVWCQAYKASAADSEPGLPLRLDPDMNTPSKRSTLKETYAQIIKDLKLAADLLPAKQISPSRPSKTAALAYLARTYLMMGDYQSALAYSLEALSYQNSLMDFNILKLSDSYPFKEMNSEINLLAYMNTTDPVNGTIAKVPQEIYDLYDDDDLRKSAYFRMNDDGTISFRGNYSGNIVGKLSSVAMDEIYLMVAESYAQLNDVDNAMKYLNALLITRWKTGTYIYRTAHSTAEALQIIALERRKELLFRSTRWMDVKRYNRDGAGIILRRTVKGITYILPPDDPRYALAIPEEIIELSGIAQNPR